MAVNGESPLMFNEYGQDNDDNYIESDDNDSNDDFVYEHYSEYDDIHNPHLLQCVMEVADDSFVGRSSKTIFTRHPSSEDVRLDIHLEVLWLQRHKILPRLRELCSDPNSRFFIWQATELVFEKPEVV